ncbi:MAG TPA: RNA-binding S4 domain-containing protein [Azospirillum sp.]|nr:RNA-binding S4 domain-containing protein [Azospirillum sp.]
MTDLDDDVEIEDGLPDPGPGRLRIDKWLWYARFFKTRSLAAKLVNGGAVRCAGNAVGKAHFAVKPGDVLTFPQGRHIRVIKVRALGSRRGPAEEARTLYEDLAPPAPETAMERAVRPAGLREAGAGRPTKRERRAVERLHGEE